MYGTLSALLYGRNCFLTQDSMCTALAGQFPVQRPLHVPDCSGFLLRLGPGLSLAQLQGDNLALSSWFKTPLVDWISSASPMSHIQQWNFSSSKHDMSRAEQRWEWKCYLYTKFLWRKSIWATVET